MEDLLVVILKNVSKQLTVYFLSVVLSTFAILVLNWHHKAHRGITEIAHGDKAISHCKIFHFFVFYKCVRIINTQVFLIIINYYVLIILDNKIDMSP